MNRTLSSTRYCKENFWSHRDRLLVTNRDPVTKRYDRRVRLENFTQFFICSTSPEREVYKTKLTRLVPPWTHIKQKFSRRPQDYTSTLTLREETLHCSILYFSNVSHFSDTTQPPIIVLLVPSGK